MRLSFNEDIEVVDSAGVVRKVATSTGGMFSNGVQSNYVEQLGWSSGPIIAPSSMTAYGISYVKMTGTDPSTTPGTLTLAAPIPGVRKTIILGSTAAYINTLDIDLGTGVSLGDANQFIGFSTLGTGYQGLELVGISTTLWGVIGVNSTVGTFNAATGIRSLSASRTS